MDKGINELNNKLLDDILKHSCDSGRINIYTYLQNKGYSTQLASGIKNKLIRDGYAVRDDSEDFSVRISTEGVLFIKDGGYITKRFKEYIPPATSLIGCVTGTISFFWHVFAWLFG